MLNPEQTCSLQACEWPHGCFTGWTTPSPSKKKRLEKREWINFWLGGELNSGTGSAGGASGFLSLGNPLNRTHELSILGNLRPKSRNRELAWTNQPIICLNANGLSLARTNFLATQRQTDLGFFHPEIDSSLHSTAAQGCVCHPWGLHLCISFCTSPLGYSVSEAGALGLHITQEAFLWASIEYWPLAGRMGKH